MSKLLALDLSSNIGWAMFDPTAEQDKRVRFGTLSYAGQGPTRICGQFGDWLDDMFSVDRWDGMAWEGSWLNYKGGDTVHKLEILIGLVGVCYRFVGSRHHLMPHLKVDSQEVKKRMTGRRDADKADVIKACWETGWKVKTDHEADACGVGLVAYRRIWPARVAA